MTDRQARKRRRPARPTSRPKRWEEAASNAISALEELLSIQEEYQDWLDGLPENLQDSPTAELLDEVTSHDISDLIDQVQELADVQLPRGFGRD